MVYGVFRVIGGTAMVLVDDLFLPLTARPSFLIFLTYLTGFVALPFRGVGADLEEPHLRLIYSTSWNRGFDETPIILHIYTAHQSGLVL